MYLPSRCTIYLWHSRCCRLILIILIGTVPGSLDFVVYLSVDMIANCGAPAMTAIDYHGQPMNTHNTGLCCLRQQATENHTGTAVQQYVSVVAWIIMNAVSTENKHTCR